MKIAAPIPILRIFDEGKAREFYIEFLGFTVNWEHRFEEDLPLYMEVEKHQCVIHLSGHHGDSTPGARLYIPIEGVAEYNKELRNKKYKHARPGVCDTPWGANEMTVTDPFGNRLTFAERKEG